MTLHSELQSERVQQHSMCLLSTCAPVWTACVCSTRDQIKINMQKKKWSRRRAETPEIQEVYSKRRRSDALHVWATGSGQERGSFLNYFKETI